MHNLDLINSTVDAFNKKGFESKFFETKEDLLNDIENYINKDDVVTFGGSMTLFESGMMDKLRQMQADNEIVLLDRYAEGADIPKIYRDAFSSNVYFSSSNAVIADGTLYNVDGNGNRVAAMTFGPASVIVIVGYNKIVADKAEAVERVEKIAAPKNGVRLKLDTPCAKLGYCAHCSSPQKMCRIFSFIGSQQVPKRIKVFIVGEQLGY